MSIKVALVEDNHSLRKRFSENFSYFDNINLVLITINGEEFLNKLALLDKKMVPNVVLMDIELPGISGIETTRKMKENFPQIEVIMLTVFEDIDKIMQSIRAGASGYLLKDETPTGIVNALEDLLKGGAPMSPVIARKLVNDIHHNTAKDTKNDGDEYDLSDRELTILEHLVDGKNYQEISELMVISPHTVKTHIKNIYKKMHVHSRAAVVKTAINKKLVSWLLSF